MTQPPDWAIAGARASKKPAIGALAACVSVACAALLSPFVSTWESGGQQHLTPYRDIGGVWTQCDGETLGVTATSPTETPAGCAVKLDKRLAGFAQAVAIRSPALRGHDNQWAAVTSLTYNIGTQAYAGSTVAKRLDARQWAAACDAILMWDKVGGKRVAGLANRRRAERALCMKDLPK
ncbi:lysozyme [Sphingomonas sp. UYP23]